MSIASTPNPRPTGVSASALSSMFEAVGGLRNRRALTAMLGCLFAAVLLGGLFSVMAPRMGMFMAGLGALLFMVVALTGVNAAGVLLMDQARGAPLRGLVDAIVYGLLCIPKFVVLAIALSLVALVVFIALALLFLVCKIPGIGPILFVVVFPFSVVVSGLTLCGLFLCMFLALPAIWEGSTITRAIAQALAIVRSRLVEALLLMVVLWFLSVMVGLIVFSILGTGLMPSIGLSASILGGFGSGMQSIAGMMGGMMGGGGYGGGGFGGGYGGGGGGGGGYAIAAGIGGGLLWALAASLVAQVYLLGLNLVYLRVTEGLDAGATEAAMRSRLDDAKRRAADLGQKARDAAERAREQARHAASSSADAASAASAAAAAHAPSAANPVPVSGPASAAAPGTSSAAATPPAAAASQSCPQCHSAVSSSDAFCGVCGHKLK